MVWFLFSGNQKLDLMCVSFLEGPIVLNSSGRLQFRAICILYGYIVLVSTHPNFVFISCARARERGDLTNVFSHHLQH
jgi:hypothetical protein